MLSQTPTSLGETSSLRSMLGAPPQEASRATEAIPAKDRVIFTECDGDILFAPIKWGGSHWVLVILDLRASKKILFVDPLGASVLDVLHTALMSCFLDDDFVNFSPRVQFDGFHCGAWCVFLAEEYINFCRSDVFSYY